MFEFLRFLYLNLDFFVSFLLYDFFFLSDDFLPSSHGTMFSRVDNFPNCFRSDIRRFFWAWKFWFHRRFPCSFSEHTQWNEVEAIHVGSLLGWTIGRTVMRQRARQKSNRFKFKAKEQLCNCITLFWTLIRLLGTQFKRVRIHLTKSVSWNNRDEGVKNVNSLFYETFSLPSPSSESHYANLNSDVRILVRGHCVVIVKLSFL